MKSFLLILCLSLGYILAEDCFQKNTRIQGTGLNKLKIKKNSSLECLSLCEATEGCLGIVYYTDEYNKKKLRKRCFMYKEIKKTWKSSKTVTAIINNCLETSTSGQSQSTISPTSPPKTTVQPNPSPPDACRSILVSGELEQKGLYFQKKTTSNLNLPRQTPNTAVYDNVGGNYIYHKKNSGWMIVYADNPRPLVVSNVMNTDIVAGGSWESGVKITCLDNGNCVTVEDESRSSQDEVLENQFPFNGMPESSDGTFCSRLEYSGQVFEYTNRTENGLPTYASEDFVLAPDKEELKRGLSGTYKLFPTGTNRNANELNFDKRSARSTRKSQDDMPATSIHARWYLPYGSLSEATTWELGVTIKVLNSHLHTYFMTVGWSPGGYSGIQETSDTGKAPSGKLALFSFWNHGTDSVMLDYVNKESGVRDSTFGGEGTGRKSWIDHPWSIGKETAMMIKGRLMDVSKNLWEVRGFVKSIEEPDSWIHMATFSREGLQDPLNYYGFNAFVEDWYRPPCGQGFRHKRAAEFTSPYAKINDKKVQLRSPLFTYSNHRFDAYARNLVTQTDLGGGDVYMSTGGVPDDLLS